MNDRHHPTSTSTTAPLLQVRHLSKHFAIKQRHAPARNRFGLHFGPRPVEILKAVEDVSFDIVRGETFGIVGESGSGKTTCARCILRALDPTAGTVLFTNNERTVDLAKLTDHQLKPLRTEMQMIFQDPFSSLNPRMTVGDIVGEPLLIHGIGSRRERTDRVAAMLERVGLLSSHTSRYPHAFSGGQRQRVGIARALILNPAFVVADEAVSALDVSVQAQVLDLLKDLQRELKLTYIFVSHNLAVIKMICDHVAVMYKGRLVELGAADQVLTRPRHAYTKVLLSAVPHPDPDVQMKPLSVADLTPEELAPTFVDPLPA